MSRLLWIVSRNTFIRWASIALVGWAAACASDGADSRALVIAWMECEECEDAQRDSVLALGRQIVPILTEFLLMGPPQVRTDSLEAHLSQQYATLAAYALTHSNVSLPSERDYVGAYVSGYRMKYRMRSALLLGLLGGVEARQALDSALATQPPTHLRRMIDFARDSLWSP